MNFDVVVIGAGVMGSSLAWRLSEAGLRVFVCDGRLPGEDASWAAAGILCAQAEAGEPGPFLDLLLGAEESWSELAGWLEVQRQGVLHVAFTEDEREALRRQRAWQLERGLEVDFLEPEELRRLEPGLNSDVVAANFFPRGGHLDSSRLPSAFQRRAERLGAIWWPAEVSAIEIEAGRVCGVRVDGDTIDARLVIVAAGAWSANLLGVVPGLVPDAVVPVRGQLIAFPVAPPPVSRAVFGAGGYVLPRNGDLCLAGTTMEWVGFDAKVTAEARELLQRRASRLCPSLASRAPSGHWVGLRPATADGLPALGPTPIEGLHLATGLFRNGILLAPLASALVARAMAGERDVIPPPFRAERLFGATS